MKIEEGKFYRTSEGEKVGPVLRFDDMTMHLGGDDGRLWWADSGEGYCGGCADLIAEWVDEPQIEVGKTYPDRAGREWECLFIRDDVAFMQFVGGGDAYRYKLDGTPISFGSLNQYTIDLGPVRGEVVVFTDVDFEFTDSKCDWDSHKITIPTLDGKPAVGTYTGENGLCVKIEEVE